MFFNAGYAQHLIFDTCISSVKSCGELRKGSIQAAKRSTVTQIPKSKGRRAE
jgi:hypothetical protein